MLKLKITHRALLLFIIISVVPVLSLNTFWLSSHKKILRKEAEKQQQLFANLAAVRSNTFMVNKINSIIIHSQTSSILETDIEGSAAELKNLMQQDDDITQLILYSPEGKVLLDIQSEGRPHNIADPSKDKKSLSAFKVVTFLSGKEYISPVYYDKTHPYFIVAVPIIDASTLGNQSRLSTSERGVIRGAGDIQGALLSVIDIRDNIGGDLLDDPDEATKTFIINNQQQLVSHQHHTEENHLVNVNEFPSVQYFKDNDQDSGVVELHGSIDHVPVIAAAARVPTTDWLLIAERPISDVNKEAGRISNLVFGMNVLLGIGVSVIAYIFSYRITNPIKSLAKEAEKMGAGNLDQPIKATARHDEIGSLARSLKQMGHRLNSMVRGIVNERDQLDFVLNSVTEGIFVLDGQGNVKLANKPAYELFGVNQNELRGKPFKDIAVFQQDVSKVGIDPNNVALGEKIVEFKNLKFTNRNGGVRYIDVIMARYVVPENDIGSIVTVFDRTASSELESMKIDFVSLAAHELRTPLTAIRGYLELILKDKEVKISDKHRHWLLQMNDTSQQLASLINNLLNVSKIERGALKMSTDKIDWAKMINKSVKDAQFSAEKTETKLSYKGHESGEYVLGDPVALREVIDNLISNALRYTPVGGDVVVSCERDGEEINVTVEDNGIGISKDDQRKLFTKFYRVHGGLATGSGGSGLGLYISKSIMELHKGSIWVTSQEGVGSVFHLTLPRVESDLDSKNKQDFSGKNRGWVTKNTNN